MPKMIFLLKKDAKAIEKKLAKKGYKTKISKESKQFNGYGTGYVLYSQEKKRR